jgi:hypothetical protein
MKISYAITVCNEFQEIQKLLEFLLENKRKEDEICVLLDKPKSTHLITDLLYIYSSKDLITLKESAFPGDFSEWKNELNRMCKGDIIINLDADEIPHKHLIQFLPTILETNNVDLLWVPRVNTVEGITQEHIKKWGWNINEKKWINFPDIQGRIFKNSPNIKWVGKVHEKVEGYKTVSYLPFEEEWSLYHPKSIEKQEKQNNFYNKL